MLVVLLYGVRKGARERKKKVLFTPTDDVRPAGKATIIKKEKKKAKEQLKRIEVVKKNTFKRLTQKTLASALRNEQADNADKAISLENDLEESEAIAPPPAAVQVNQIGDIEEHQNQIKFLKEQLLQKEREIQKLKEDSEALRQENQIIHVIKDDINVMKGQFTELLSRQVIQSREEEERQDVVQIAGVRIDASQLRKAKNAKILGARIRRVTLGYFKPEDHPFLGFKKPTNSHKKDFIKIKSFQAEEIKKVVIHLQNTPGTALRGVEEGDITLEVVHQFMRRALNAKRYNNQTNGNEEEEETEGEEENEGEE